MDRQFHTFFFADDSLLFCKATEGETEEVIRIIQAYRRASGQEVNLEKSSLFFSKNMNNERIESVTRPLGNMQRVQQSKYLGLPLIIGRSKSSSLRFIKEKLSKRIANWKGKLLSPVGKEVLLKSVALALPNHAMAVFKLPVGMCKEISKMMAKFWWGSSENENKIHWKNWKDMSEIKGKGGLGFRDVQCFNTSLLAKQVWRIMTQPNLLVSKVVKSKYFPKTPILQARCKNGDSWIWRSLQSSIEMLESGLRKQVGNGKSIEIWKDKWLMNHSSGMISSTKPPNCELVKVDQLIQAQKWNESLINLIFSAEEAKAITEIPLSICGRRDKYVWTGTMHGSYTTKSGYVRAKEMQEEKGKQMQQKVGTSKNKSVAKIWHQVWDLNVKHKVKHFIWKCLHDILPTNENVYRRTGKGDPWCRRCGEAVETIEHLLLECSTNEMAWKNFPISWDGLVKQQQNFWNWWEELQGARQRKEGKEHVEATVVMLWHIWKSRNNLTFKNKQQDGFRVAKDAVADWREFSDADIVKRQTGLTEDHQFSAEGRYRKENLKQHSVIIQTDAAVNHGKNRNGIGIVARSNTGTLLNTWALPCSLRGQPIVIEAMAIRSAMLKAIEENWTSILIISDCKELIRSINDDCRILPEADVIVEDVKTLRHSFWICSFWFMGRDLNTCSDGLAKFATNLIDVSRWKENFPVWVSHTAQNDFLAIASHCI